MIKCDLTVTKHSPKGEIIYLKPGDVPPPNTRQIKYSYIESKDDWDSLYEEIIENNPHYSMRHKPSISCFYGQKRRIDVAEEMLVEQIEEDCERAFGKPFNVYWQLTDDEFDNLDKEVQEWMEY